MFFLIKKSINKYVIQKLIHEAKNSVFVRNPNQKLQNVSFCTNHSKNMLRKRPLMTFDIRGSRGVQDNPKIGRYGVGKGW